MKRIAIAAAVALSFAAAGVAQANEKLAQSSGCLACHAVDKKGPIGPGFKDIGAKYRTDKGAADKLAAKVKAGGKGVWGEIAMPPNAHVKDPDIKALVTWILSLK